MTAKRQQYLYLLRPVPRLRVESHWTAADNAAVDRHFAHLQALLAAGKLILAGKTAGLDESTFGIVILEAESEEEAREIMSSDPAVVAGVMLAELFPYHVALLRSS